MPRGRPQTFTLTLSEFERAQFMALANSRALPHRLVRRAHIILRSADSDEYERKFSVR